MQVTNEHALDSDRVGHSFKGWELALGPNNIQD
jgi:hypothetical protein